jgi:hypothetical protein
MSRTSDIPLEGSPLSASYREQIENMRSDLVALNRYRDILDNLSMTYPMGGGGGGSDAIVARIVAEAGPSEQYGRFYTGVDVKTDSAVLLYNTMEIGLVCQGGPDDFIPPGLDINCLTEAFPGGEGPTYVCDPIAAGTHVVAHDVGETMGQGAKLWAFSCPVPMCVLCPEGFARRFEREDGSFVAPEKPEMPRSSDTAHRGYM